MELEQRLAVVALQVQRLGLNDRHLLGDGADALEAGQRFAHVVEHAEVEDHVELADLVEVDGLEVGHQRLDRRAQRGCRQLEPPSSRQVGLPEVLLVPGLVGQRAVLDALGPVGAAGGEVDAPGVVVQRDDPCGAGPLGLERVLPVPGADVEDGAAWHVGEDGRPVVLRAVALGDDAVAQVNGVVPVQCVGLCLQISGGGHRSESVARPRPAVRRPSGPTEGDRGRR